MGDLSAAVEKLALIRLPMRTSTSQKNVARNTRGSVGAISEREEDNVNKRNEKKTATIRTGAPPGYSRRVTLNYKTRGKLEENDSEVY